MVEINEREVASRENTKRILTLKVLDSIHSEVGDFIIDWRKDNAGDLVISFNLDNKCLYETGSKQKIEKIISSLFVDAGTTITKGSDGDRIKGDGLKLVDRQGKAYVYNGGTNIFHVGGVWFIIVNNNLIPLQWKGLDMEISNTGTGIIGFEDKGEIILKKFIKKGAKYGTRSGYPYITLPGNRISQLDKGSSIFFVINEGNVDKIVLEDMQEIVTGDDPIKFRVEQTLSFEQFGEIQQVESDINENFVLMIGKKDDKFTLYVLGKNGWECGEVIVSIPGVKEFVVTPDNALLGVMEDGNLKKISTTFDQFEKGYFDKGGEVVMREDAVKVVKNNSNERMIEAINSTELQEGNLGIESEEFSVSEQDVILEFWSKEIPGENKTIKELFEEAKTQEEIKRVERLVNKLLVKISSFQGGLAIKNYIKDIIIKKKEKIILNDFQEEVNSTEDTLNKADNFQDLVNVKLLIDSLHERRKSLHGGALAIDLGKKIQEMRKSVEKKISEYQEEGKEDILLKIQKNIEELKLYIEAISYGADLSQIYNLDIRKQTMDLLEYLDEDEKKKQKKNLLELVSKKSSEILNEEKKETEKKELEIIRRKNEIDEEIDILIGMLETVHSIESVNEMKETDVLAKKIESEIADLPTSVSGELEIKYNKAFKDRIFYIRRENIKEKGIAQNLDDSGIDTMLYYVETQQQGISWKLVGTPTSQGLIKLGISLDDGKRQYTGDDFFENSDKFADVLIGDDIEFEITKSEFIKLNKQIEKRKSYGKLELNKLIKNLSEEKNIEKKESILKEIKDVKSQYKKARYVEKIASRLIEKEKLNPRSYVPEVDHSYVVLDEEKDIFKEISGKLLSQKKRSGITVLKGGPGLGKTVMCEYLAAVTNREIIRVQCSKKISYSEFFFAPTLKKGETSYSPAEWIKMMQKPGTIILFDEIDKLNADCMAGLHALFDRGRHVHDPQLGDFYANPDCLFLGTMNAYDPLPKAIASRSTFEEISYPSEENEAYKISKYTDNDLLTGLTFEEFKELWNDRVVRKTKIKGEKKHKLDELLDNIKKLLEVFKILREKYEGDYEKFEYELSYRDAAQVFDAYAVNNDFKKSLTDALVSDADSVVGVEIKKEQREMVIEAIDKVFGR